MGELRRAARLFHAARRLDPQQREPYLAEVCDGDARLRAEVESLLRADDQPAGLTQMLDASIERQVASMAQQIGEGALTAAAEQAEAERRPQRIGHFTIAGIIARGGMGTVYEAHQERPRRAVALKVLTRELASDSARRRFEYESQLLGQLSHPGIAQVHEAGVCDDGGAQLPYFAMELIPGALPITEYVRHEESPLRRRLELFADACDAVHHAHQRGVIHRDLKPGNVLVDEAGAVKIIDFGVARSLESAGQGFTQTGQLIGTLQYMSPEQCEGRAREVDVRSDVYALGVMLYELITGRPPYDVAALSVPEAARLIGERQPVRPSSSTAGVRGEIDWIALKALEKPPQRRYQSAHDLARDVRAYLAGESVSARPPTLLYQARVLARRHRAVAASAVVGVLMLALATAGTSAGLIQAERHRQLEQQARANAEQATHRLSHLYTAINPATGQGRDAALASLAEASAWLEHADLSHQPELLVAVVDGIGRAQLTLGLYQPASDTFAAALMHAQQTFDPDDLRIAELLDHLGAARLHAQLDGASSEHLLRRSLDIYRSHFPEESPEIARGKYRLSEAIIYTEEAGGLLAEALQAQRRALGSEHPETLATMTRLASRLMDFGQEEQAEELLREALDAQRRFLGFDHPDVAETLISLGWMLSWREPGGEAERLLRDGLAIRRAIFGPDHPLTANAEDTLARSLGQLGELEEAVGLLRHAQAVRAAHLPHGHPSRFWTARKLGIYLFQLGEAEEAADWLTRAIDHATPADGSVTHNAGWARATLANGLWSIGRTDEAIDLMSLAVEQMSATGPPDHPRLRAAESYLTQWLAGP